MLKQLTKIIKHSLTMMKVHWQAYLSLSITITISLGLFLGILVYYDTTYFNEYKSDISIPPNIIQSGDGNLQTANALTIMSQKYDDTFAFSWRDGGVDLPSYQRSIFGHLTFVDHNFFNFPIEGNHGFVSHNIIEGRLFTHEEISNNEKIILIEEKFKDILFGTEEAIGQEILLPTNFSGDSIPTDVTPYTIIGVVQSHDTYPSDILDDESMMIDGRLYLPLNALVDFKDIQTLSYTLVVAKSPEVQREIYQTLFLEGMHTTSSLWHIEYASHAYIEMRESQISLLAIVLIILSLNLFSLHSNVLKKRQQEIAIKRALGASKRTIIIEFFIEGLFIFLINFLVVCFLISTIAVIWYYFNHNLYQGYNLKSLVIMPFSIQLFIIVSILMTILNSMILAYQATRINIIDAIKAE